MKLFLWNDFHYSLRYQARTERHSRKFWSASDNKMRRPVDLVDYKQTQVSVAVIGASLEFRG